MLQPRNELGDLKKLVSLTEGTRKRGESSMWDRFLGEGQALGMNSGKKGMHFLAVWHITSKSTIRVFSSLSYVSAKNHPIDSNACYKKYENPKLALASDQEASMITLFLLPV